MIRRLLDRLPWPTLFLVCATLGLAPFSPPHIWGKLNMLTSGNLRAPLDAFDLLLHGTPWLLLIAKAMTLLSRGETTAQKGQ